MTLTTSPDLRPSGASGSSATPPPPASGGTGRGRWPAPGSRRRRPLLVVLAVVALVLVAIPVGLSQLAGRAGSSATESQSFGAPDRGEGLGSSPASGSSGADSGADSGGRASADGSAGAAPLAPAGRPGTSPSVGTALPVVDGAKVARSAWLGLQVTDLAVAAGRARSIASAAGGSVLTEDISTAVDPLGSATTKGSGVDLGLRDGSAGSPDGAGSSSDGSTNSGSTSGDRAGSDASYPGYPGYPGPVGLHQGRLTLTVPAPRLDGVLTELSTLGTVSYRSAQAQDVTASDIDVRARIAPARASIERVQALMAKASDLQQLLSLESELTRRQSDLDSLTQQLADLDRRTTTSDVTVTLWTPAAAEEVSKDSGVVASLTSAWQGLLTSLTVILTGVAVLLPWLALIALGALVWVRVARRRRAPVAD